MSAAVPKARTMPGGDPTLGSDARERSTNRNTSHTEYFSISPFLYSFPVSVRGSCVSNATDRGHL